MRNCFVIGCSKNMGAALAADIVLYDVESSMGTISV